MAQVPRARLGEYREQSGAISFRITSAPDFSATIAELKRRVPGWARQYNARTREWRIKTEFRDVLEDLFLNVPSLYASGARGGKFEEEGPRGQWLWVILVALLVITGGALLWAQRSKAPAATADAVQPAPARAASPAAPLYASQPGKVTSIVNLRSGPGTSFAVRSKVDAGAPVTAVAKQQADDGYWWLLLDGGAWVRSDLVVSTEAGELPLDLERLPDTKNAGAAAAELAQAAEVSAPTGRIEATVTWVSNGDTLHVQIAGREYRVRYIGVTAPTRDEAHYQEASDANSALVAGKVVQLERDSSDSDSLGRLLRYVYLEDGTLVNEALVRAGWARATPVQPDVAQAAALQAAEAAARQAGIGIWALQ